MSKDKPTTQLPSIPEELTYDAIQERDGILTARVRARDLRRAVDWLRGFADSRLRKAVAR